MRADVADSRIVAATAATLTFTGRDADGEEADPGSVTVGVVDSAGDEVIAPLTATSTTTTEVTDDTRTVALTASETAAVDRLTATWTVSGTTVGTTVHDVVGGVYVTTAQIRAKASAQGDPADNSKATLLAARTEVEYQFEDACNRAFVPRFATETLDGTGTDRLILDWPDLREVVWAQYWNGTEWATLTGVTVADIPASTPGFAELKSGCWPRGRSNIRLGYRYGWDRPPQDLVKAAVLAIEHRLTSITSGLDARAISIQGTDLGNVTLATAGLGNWITALPEVDEVVNRYRFHRIGVA